VPASCPAADVRPFGVGINDGVVYLGMVCSAESSQDITKLRAYVYAFANGAFTNTPTLDFSLNYNRNAANLQWKYWLNRTTFNKNDATQAGGKWAQPWLTDITFDNGDMILGLRDRNADQFGSVAGGPDPADTQNYSGIARGDILRSCTNGNGGWALEFNGKCGAITTGGANNHEGPGDGEYYFQDMQINPVHNETSFGAQVQIPGLPDVVSVIHNPIENHNAVSDGGIKWYNNTTSTTTRSYLVFDASGNPVLFEKANGMGDIEALCPLTPTEIGNRVWQDTNRNGIQDAGESGLDGVTVDLYRNGVLVGSTTTANGGQYYFNNINVNQNGASGLVTGTGAPGGISEYEIRIPNATGASQQASLAGLSLTQAAGDPSANGKARDSDGGLNGVTAVYTLLYTDLANPGANNHSFDFGFTPAAPALETLSLGNLIWNDANNNGLVDNGEVGIPNVTVNLYLDSNQDGMPDGAVIAQTQTNANGYYLFTNLNPDSYIVEVIPPAGFTSSTGGNSEPAPDPNVNPTDNRDYCTMRAGIARTGPVTLTPGGEPTGEPATPGLPDTTADNNANYMVDCGFFPLPPLTIPASLGDFVWHDKNSNGLQDAGEEPVVGVTVTLYSGAGVQLATTNTNANGLYHFTDLQPGDYAVCFTLPPGNQLTRANQGTDDTLDSDADPTSGCTPKITLVSNQTDLTWDAGIITPAVLVSALGGCTWNDGLDSQADGIREPNEQLLTGITAILLDANGHEIRRTTTDANGCYIFEDLTPSNYMVSFVLPSEFTGFTITQSGSNGSDANPISGQTVLIRLPAGVRDLTWDAGFVSQPTALPPEQEPQAQNRIFLPWVVQ
jgi:hypothetical protein